MINNRQNGRRRGRNGNGQRAGNPGNPGGGSRIDNRARGNANQLYEKYKNLARDAQMSGDRVNTEYYLQFADHYFRVLNENRSRFEDEGQRRIAPVNSFDDPYGDDDYVDEGEPIRAGEQGASGGRDQQREQGRDQPRDQQRREFGDNSQRQGNHRGDVNRGERQRDGEQGDDRRQEYAPREGQRGGDQREAGQRDATQRDRGEREDGRRRDVRAERTPAVEDREDRFAVTGSPVANDPGEDSPDGAEPTPLAPRRRGRPRQEAAAAAANDAPVAIDADRLPPSLSLANPPAADLPEGEEAPRPRRRRAPRAAAAGEVTQAG